MIKVCFVSPGSYTYFFDDKEITSGGAEYQMFLLANQLSTIKDFNISFLLEKVPETDTVHNEIHLQRSFIFKKGNSIFKKINIVLKYYRILKKLKPDLVITTTANPIVGFTAFYKKILKFKHIHRTAHLFDVDGSWINTAGIIGKIYRYGLNKADLILTQTYEHQEILEKVHSLQSEVLCNAIEIKSLSSKGKSGVLWVGRYENWKNPEMVLQIAQSLPNLTFTMICPAAKPVLKDYQNLKGKAKKINNLTFIERVPFKKIQSYFNKAEVFINTSEKEGFPNTFLQAAEAKIPVVSYKVNPDQYLEKYNCGIACNGNLDFLVNILKNIRENKEDQIEKGLNHYKYLKEFHDLNAVSRKLEALIKKLFNENR